MIKEVDILGGLKVLSRLRLEFYFKSLIYLIILPLWLNKGKLVLMKRENTIRQADKQIIEHK